MTNSNDTFIILLANSFIRIFFIRRYDLAFYFIFKSIGNILQLSIPQKTPILANTDRHSSP